MLEKRQLLLKNDEIIHYLEQGNELFHHHCFTHHYSYDSLKRFILLLPI